MDRIAGQHHADGAHDGDQSEDREEPARKAREQRAFGHSRSTTVNGLTFSSHSVSLSMSR